MIDKTIWVEKDSYHTAIIVSQAQIKTYCPQFLPNVLVPFSDKTYIRFGWGDREYYGADKKNFYKLFKALIFPTRAVMEVSGFSAVEDAGEWIIALNKKEINHVSLLNSIQKYFYVNKNYEVELLRKESNGCWYYRSKGIYFLFSNCNNWTAKMLKRSGLAIRYWYAFLSPFVMGQLVDKE
ncbi:MAG: DUF2459 domain-containing protein [Cellvibrionaceae bacterium]